MPGFLTCADPQPIGSSLVDCHTTNLLARSSNLFGLCMFQAGSIESTDRPDVMVTLFAEASYAF